MRDGRRERRVTCRRHWIFCTAGLLLLGCVSTAPPAGGEEFKVITYNAWLGFNGGETADKGIAWIKERAPDVIALQELRGFTEVKLARAAEQWGHDYIAIYRRHGGFPLGLTSRTPIEVVETWQDGKLRGFLHCRTAGIHFFVVHFNSHSYERRRPESAAVAQRVGPLVEGGEGVVVLGDFNAFSPQDRRTIEGQTALLKRFREKEAASKKHAYFENGRLDYSVVQQLLDVGLVDPCHRLLEGTPALAGTFPTFVLDPEMTASEHDGQLRRIDYILMDPELAARCTAADIPRYQPILNQISDHYPVVVRLRR